MMKRADGMAAFSQPGEDPYKASRDGHAQEDSCADRKEKSKKSVYIYIATLFIVALLFTLLSYFVQQRNNTEINSLSRINATAQQNLENLLSDNLKLRSENDTDKKQISELKKKIDELEKQIGDIRQQWQDEVRNVITNDRMAYDALLQRYAALADNNEQR